MSQMLLIRCDDESVFLSYIETSQPAPGGCGWLLTVVFGLPAFQL